MTYLIAWVLGAIIGYLVLRHALDRDAMGLLLMCAFWPLSFIAGVVIIIWSLLAGTLIEENEG